MKKRVVPKELSWLSFNARVLEEAADPSVPLLERVKFLGIYSSNLDEFFRVRVATLKRLARIGKKAKKVTGLDPKKVLKDVQKVVLEQNRTFDKLYQLILKELAQKNIYIINERKLDKEQREFVKSYFHQEVRPKLIPIMIDQVEEFPQLKNDSIYLAVRLSKRSDTQKIMHALIEIPTDSLPRFLKLPKKNKANYIMLLDDVIRYGLKDIFSIFDFDNFKAYSLKLTRDAELDIDEDFSESYIRKVHKSLKKRKTGSPVSFIYDSRIPDDLLAFLTERMNISKDDTIIPGSRYHNFKDFIGFPDLGLKLLKYKPVGALSHKDIDSKKSLFDIMREKDFLLHFPYQSFHPVIDLLREASIDPKVVSINICLYRLARQSSVVNALINAVKNGKRVCAVMELQARFDEEANIYWSDRLQEEGARVIHGVLGLKVHSKLCLITRKEKGKLRHYAIVGTGNFNEETAKIYSDHCLFTADRRITNEVAKVFEFFEENYKITTFKHLIVSPFHLRKKMVRFIKNEIKNAQEGKEAYIILKLNNLVDTALIEKLYEASQAGVKINLMVRGMFSLRPGIPGMSKNIETRSIVDKYLEHTRILVFCNGGEERIYITSADLMPRNIDRRVEVTCPIYDEAIKQELRTFVEIQWRDNVKAKIRHKDLTQSAREDDLQEKIRAQLDIYEFLENQAGERDRLNP